MVTSLCRAFDAIPSGSSPQLQLLLLRLLLLKSSSCTAHTTLVLLSADFVVLKYSGDTVLCSIFVVQDGVVCRLLFSVVRILNPTVLPFVGSKITIRSVSYFCFVCSRVCACPLLQDSSRETSRKIIYSIQALSSTATKGERQLSLSIGVHTGVVIETGDLNKSGFFHARCSLSSGGLPSHTTDSTSYITQSSFISNVVFQFQ